MKKLKTIDELEKDVKRIQKEIVDIIVKEIDKSPEMKELKREVAEFFILFPIFGLFLCLMGLGSGIAFDITSVPAILALVGGGSCLGGIIYFIVEIKRNS